MAGQLCMWLCELLAAGLQYYNYDYHTMCNAFCSCHGALSLILESEVLDVT